MSRVQISLAVLGLVLILVEIASEVFFVPMTTLTISLTKVYAVISFGAFLGAACVAGLLAMVIPFYVVIALRRKRSRWIAINATLLVVGSIATVFLVADIVFSFGYIPVGDEYPNGFIAEPNWAIFGNLVGPILIAAWIVSATSRLIWLRLRSTKTSTN